VNAATDEKDRQYRAREEELAKRNQIPVAAKDQDADVYSQSESDDDDEDSE
jgi:hypothetical protein